MTQAANPDVDGNRTSASVAPIRKGIVYASHPGEELRGDFYAPAGTGPFPVIVAAPGGGWFVRCAANKLPVFLAWGTADEVVNPRSQSEPFLRALRQAGVAVRECPIDGAGHFDGLRARP